MTMLSNLCNVFLSFSLSCVTFRASGSMQVQIFERWIAFWCLYLMFIGMQLGEMAGKCIHKRVMRRHRAVICGISPSPCLCACSFCKFPFTLNHISSWQTEWANDNFNSLTASKSHLHPHPPRSSSSSSSSSSPGRHKSVMRSMQMLFMRRILIATVHTKFCPLTRVEREEWTNQIPSPHASGQ